MSRQIHVENMHEKGMDTKQIAEALGITRHDVNRCLSDMRRKRSGESALIVAERVEDYALYNHRKAVTGARKALEAMGA